MEAEISHQASGIPLAVFPIVQLKEIQFLPLERISTSDAVVWDAV